jgi:Zn-dependent protease
MSYNPFLIDDHPLHHAGRPRISFSATEVLHLAVSVLVLTVAFTLYSEQPPLTRLWDVSPLAALAAFLAMGSGFVLHELAHKVVAQRYGHWAEFRAHFLGLLGSVLLAILGPILVAAPGAVLIQGRVTPKENGLISLVGPGTNLVISAAAFPFTLKANLDAGLPFVMHAIATVNALLAIFNLIPLGPLDGRKVLAWNKPAYAAALVVAIAWFVVTFARPFNL